MAKFSSCPLTRPYASVPRNAATKPSDAAQNWINEESNSAFAMRESSFGEEDGMTPKEVLALCKSKNVQLVDVKFCDFLGTWQHFCAPISELDEDVFEAGLGFDGSSIRGWKSIESSDMLLILDPATAIIDPFPQVTTLSIVADAIDTITHEPYSRDPR